MESADAVQIFGIGFKSANDEPIRDPDSVVVTAEGKEVATYNLNF